MADIGTGALRAVSQALVETVAAVEGSVVRVEARQRLPATGIIWSADGLVVTSNHGVEREHDLALGLPDGRRVAAALVGRDPGLDLALLRAQGSVGGLAPAPWAGSDQLAVGSLVLALGRTGPKILATLGIISALDEGWRTPAGGWVDHYLQTDAVMYPGFSGGPLVGASQQVLGVTTSALVPGLSLAIPTATVRKTVEALLSRGRVRRGYLGITAQPVQLPEALRERLGQEAGLLLVHVEPGSPAERSRLIQGDTLVRLNGRPLRSLGDLMQVLDGGSVDSTVPGTLVRGGQLREQDVVIGERGQ